MRLLKISVVAMLIVTLALIVGSVLGIAEFYLSDVFFAIVAVLMIIQVACIVTYRAKFSMRQIGFYISHIGVLVLVAGAVMSMLYGQSVNFNIPVNENAAYSQVSMEDGSVTDFGFSISVTDFELVKSQSTNNIEQYEINFRIYDGEKVEDRHLNINKPTKYNNWKFYLMGYDPDNMNIVSMHGKSDPGNIWLLTGFIMLDVGVALMCFFGLRKNRKRGKVQ